MSGAKEWKVPEVASPQDEREKIKQDCKEISERFGASKAALTESEDALFWHLEFDGPEKFGEFAAYLQSQGLLWIDDIPCNSQKVH